jgi:5-oxoprolinase (ATP-hydrolysing)
LRPNIFTLDIYKPEVLYKKVIEIDKRVTLKDYAEDPVRYKTKTESIKKAREDTVLVWGLLGEAVQIL